MPTLAEIRQQYPQYQDMSDSALADALHGKFYSDIPKADFYSKIGFQPVGVAEDSARSFGSGVLRGAASFAGVGGDISKGLASTSQALEQKGMPVQEARQEMLGAMPSFLRRYHEKPTTTIGSKEVAGAIDTVAGAPVTKYEAKTVPGQFSGTVGDFAGNPISYVGPGGAALKAGGIVLSGVGSEAAGQATKGTAYEGPARVAGAVLGGAAAAKALGPKAPKAAIPTADELRAAADQGYDAARASGLMLDQRGVGSWAASAEQQLNARGFTGGTHGTAPKTFGVLHDLQNPPAGTVGVGASNIDALRSNLRSIAQEAQPTAGGAIKPTADAAAASKVLRNLEGYTESIPPRHIVAGDAAQYVRETKLANANYAAGSRVRDFDARLSKAERATDRQIAGSLDAQIKQKAGQLLDRGAKGLNEAERAQLALIEKGGPVSNTLRQLGRAGAGVVPLGAQTLTAVATGGSLLPYQVPLAAALYGARKGSEAITKSRAQKLAEMLAKRSPEYERRVAALPPAPDMTPNTAALVRALLAAR